MSDCKRGHWIKGRAWSEGHGMGEEYGFYYTCTECGKEIKGNYDKCYSVFCPECGSRNRKMPETEEKPQNVTVGNVVPAMNKAEDGSERMSKAILTLDIMPKTCDECPLFVSMFAHQAFCAMGAKYTNEEISAEEDGNLALYYHGCLDKRPKECPLKEEG